MQAGVDVLGLELWTSHAEAQAGIRAVRALQALYADAVKKDAKATKWNSQVQPLVDAADKWDSALVFYVDADALEAGRKAQIVAKQIAAEYGLPYAGDDPALAAGLGERLQQSAGNIANTAEDALKSVKKALPWIVGGVVVLGVGAYAIPVLVPLIARARKK